MPKVILVLSGKRKSGKDYVAEVLQRIFGMEVCVLIKLSAPLKKEYANKHDLDHQKLLSSSSYKEKYRKDMIVWGELKRNEDPSYFWKAATRACHKFPVWVITDARRPSDLKVVHDSYGENGLTVTKLVRIEATEHTRSTRGWKFVCGVDDAQSECALDSGFHWDFIIHNNGSKENLLENMQPLITQVSNLLNPD
uniref:phosphomevalonate kinase-like n=1 Tax=Ciona intestinalis TaxID=7719 RepID=UPI000180BD9F|nr:phosphomevalonate kinase-like [Ciona intestinalis]|eukprot:XP_009862384.1 phosphomevalonate kinase-like [Ciona intestinalis]